MSCLWISRTGGRRASPASKHQPQHIHPVNRGTLGFGHSSSFVRRFRSPTTGLPEKTTPGEVALLPALPLLVVWSASASHANPITPQASRQRQRPFFGCLLSWSAPEPAAPVSLRRRSSRTLLVPLIELLLLLLLLLRAALLHRRRGPDQRMRLLRSRPGSWAAIAVLGRLSSDSPGLRSSDSAAAARSGSPAAEFPAARKFAAASAAFAVPDCYHCCG